MRSRSLLVVLSLLAFVAAPVEAGGKPRKTRQQKLAAQKRAAARRAAAEKPTDSGGPGGIGDTRVGKKKTGQVAAGRTPTTTSAPHHAGRPAAVPAVAATRASFDTSAAVAPRRRFVKVKRFFAGLAIVTALTAGAVGWQAADMNGKVSDGFHFVQEKIAEVIWGGHDDPGPIGGKPNKGDPAPVPDPGPQIPDPSPEPDPDPSTPSPSGGKGHQDPKGPETDNSRR